MTTATASLQDTLKDATRRLVAEFAPVQVWLFGSRAWGEPREDSDIDLLVVVPDSAESPLRRAQRAHRCLGPMAYATDVLVKTSCEMDRVRHLRSTLTHKILNEGRLLYG